MLTQEQRLDLPGVEILYLVHIEITDTDILYFCDRPFHYDYGAGSQDYQDYISEISGLGAQVDLRNKSRNPSVTIKFKNTRFRTYAHPRGFLEANPPEGRSIKIYRLILLQENESFSSDVKTLVFSGKLGQIHNITRTEFTIQANSLLESMKDYPATKALSADDYPEIDPDDVGKYPNVIYGACKEVYCPAIRAGIVTTLKDDVTESQTTIPLSEVDKVPTSGSGWIEEEKITWSGKDANGLTGVTRGAGGTTAVKHHKGNTFWVELSSDLEFLVADHPVKSIGNVYVIMQDKKINITSFVTKYTNDNGKAKVTLPPSFSIKQAVEQEADDQINVDDDIAYSTTGHLIRRYPNNASGTSWNATGDAYDGDDGTYAYYSATSQYYLHLYFPSTSLGSINFQYGWVHIGFKNNSSGSRDFKIEVKIEGGSSRYKTYTLGAGQSWDTWIRVSKSGGAWDDEILVIARYTTDGGQEYRVFEAYKEVEYVPTLSKSGSAYKEGTVSITGNSVADIKVKGKVVADVEGITDEGGNLIERPDLVIKHMLINYCGLSSNDIDDASFNDAGTNLAGWKFAFVPTQITNFFVPLLGKLATQCKCFLYEEGGKIKLKYDGPLSIPNSVPRVEPITEPVTDRSEFSYLKNNITVFYNRNWHDHAYQAKEISDNESVAKYGKKGEEVALFALTDEARAELVGRWFIGLYPHYVTKTDLSYKAERVNLLDLFALAVEAGRAYGQGKYGEGSYGQPMYQLLEKKLSTAGKITIKAKQIK